MGKTYVISDIHGCYEEYKELVHKINLKEDDHLYILGDTLDRGLEPIKALQYMMKQPNLTYIIGNHDYLFLYFVRKMKLDLSNAIHFSDEDIEDFKGYLSDGGVTTIEQFMQLSDKEKKDICEYFANANVYDEIEKDGKRYILVHAGILGFSEDIPIEEYDFLDFICERMDYGKRYYQDENTFIITGHTPTMYINENKSSEVFIGNGHIAIDCGCVYGEKLAAYCIDTGTITYVNARNK